MPHSRRFKIEIVPDVRETLEAHLELKAPIHVKTSLLAYDHRFAGAKIRGSWDPPTRIIQIHLASDLFGASSLRYVKDLLLETILHEYRHAHQQDNWDPAFLAADELKPYGMQECEKDAREWSNKQLNEWRGLVRVRPVSGSSLGRLAAAEGRVR